MSVNKKVYIIFLLLSFSLPHFAFSQSSLSLSVTPTLFEVSVEPGDVWKSSIRVVNPNTYPLTVFIEPVNFNSNNEKGISNFIPIFEDDLVSGVTLAEWIDLDNKSITIEPQAVKPVPFTVHVPSDATPGGRYAALIVSTQPTLSDVSGSRMFTTQAVSALFFMRIEGDVIEQGSIRSFRTEKSFSNRPENNFELRFENLGNVHLQPQGYISIYNMWGQLRGEIPINPSNQFGKVLPESIRQFNYGWESGFSIYDIGRYSAEVTIAYGDRNRKFVSSETYFWVIPVAGVLVVVGAFLFILFIFTWLIRFYVRRVLLSAGISNNKIHGLKNHPDDIHIKNTQTNTLQSKSAVFFKNIINLQESGHKQSSGSEKVTVATVTWLRFLIMYRLWIVLLFLLLLCIIVVFMYFRSVMLDSRIYEITITDNESVRTISSEQLLLDTYLEQGYTDHDINIDFSEVVKLSKKDVHLVIVNVSGTPGVASSLALALKEKYGDISYSVTADLERIERRSVIVFKPEMLSVAQDLSGILKGALLSSYIDDDGSDNEITIFVGSDILR